MFDRFPLAGAICYSDGFVIRVVNPAFGEAVGIRRDHLRDRPLFEVVSPIVPTDLAALSDHLLHRRHGRFGLDVKWVVKGRTRSGHLTAELVDEALIGERPLLIFLHADDQDTAPDAEFALEPMAGNILALVAGGATSAAIARTVGLTVDGVNYHLTQLSRRLNASNRAALVARAYVLGLLDGTAWPPVPTPAAGPDPRS
jgi:DNA-binding CsgD family transcriptional regulator